MGYEKPENYNDSYAAEIYETDFNTIAPHIFGLVGASFGNIGMNLDAVGEIVVIDFFVDSKVDPDSDMVITFVWQRNDVNNDTITAKYSISATKTDGSEVTQWVNPAGGIGDAITLNACNVSEYEKHVITLEKTDFDAEDVMQARLHMNEVNRDIDVVSVVVRYRLKRTLV